MTGPADDLGAKGLALLEAEEDLLGIPRDGVAGPVNPERPGTREGSVASRLVALATEAELFRDVDEERVWARIPVSGHRETWPLRGKRFAGWLRRRYYEATGKAPGVQAVTDALGVLEARGHFDGAARPVATRIAQGDDGTLYLDLADAGWRAVEITPDGWRVVTDVPVAFRRAKGTGVLPLPVPGGSLDELRPFVNVGPEADWRLLVGWLVGALRPVGPYPVLALHGEQGSAKSTTAAVLRRLVDPNTAPLRGEPREPRDLMVSAVNSWMLVYDNLSHLPNWLSDALCRLATGGGFATRELYSDGDEALFHAQRPILVNGIEEVVRRSDLLDRALLLDLPRIPDERRRPETDLWRDFETARPRLLGALLDALATALREWPRTELDRWPRMADFARWVTAAEPALGWPAGGFLAAYAENRAAGHDLALEGSPVAGAVRALVTERGSWSGTATELLAALGSSDPGTTRSPHWPKNGRALSGELKRLAPNLRAVGIEVTGDREPGGSRRRLLTVRAGGQSSVPCVPTVPSRANPGDGRDARRDDRDAVAPASSHPNAHAGGPWDDRDDRDAQTPARSREVREL